MTSTQATTPPRVGEHLLLSFPAPHVLQMMINRPKQMNSMTKELELDMGRVLDWFDEEPSLWVVILTGKGRAFCAGQDLKSWQDEQAARRKAAGGGAAKPLEKTNEGHELQAIEETQISVDRLRKGGFGSVSCRRSIKPIIAAVDGVCMGGGMEMLLNCDLAVATSRSKFALPEVSRGVVAAQGGIARVAQISGHHRASELLLTGAAVPAQELYNKYLLLNSVIEVPSSASLDEGQAAVEQAALGLASKVIANSPDAVVVTKATLNRARDGVFSLHQDAAENKLPSGLKGPSGEAEPRRGDLEDIAMEGYANTRARALYVGANINEGLQAFREKRQPQWKDPMRFNGKRDSNL